MLELMRRAVLYAENLRHILIATVDDHGVPHLAVGNRVSLDSDLCLRVTGWHCPTTQNNIEQHRSLSIVIWDPETDLGYRILGEAQEVREGTARKKRAPGNSEASRGSLEEKELVVRVKEIFLFSHALHTDRLLGGEPFAKRSTF